MPNQNSSSDAEKALRLNKYLALQLGISRRQADNLISTGTVTINGKIANLGAQISPNAVVEVSGRNVSANATAKIYIALNKPTGYVCSRRQQGNTPTIYSLLPPNMHHLKPVGRLDKDSSGLILLTNDGDFAHRMTHPSFHKTKIYKARLDRPLEPLHQQMISDFGVNLEDGRSQLTLERLGDSRRDWQITMSEGRNRQIRRTFATLGYTIIKLHRTNFGEYSLGNMKSGEFQERKLTLSQ